MKVFFPRDGQRSTRIDRPRRRPAALPRIPADVLERHGARVLRPSEAVRYSGSQAPGPTVYRYGTLLMPDEIRSRETPALNEALTQIGVQLVPVTPASDAAQAVTASRLFTSTHRSVGLQVAEGAPPGVVDAWAALQALRSAAQNRRVDPNVVAQISLEHLMFGANEATHGSPDTRDLLGGVHPALSGRLPVDVVLSAPPRRPLTALGTPRRPVVAVLDTGIGDHPWLRYVDRSQATPADEFVVVDGQLQNAIYANGLATEQATGIPAEPIDGYLDVPPIPEPLVGQLDTHSGHGTFIAGIIRQLAPDAQVRAIRVMHSDGFAHESDVLLALAAIAAEVDRAQHGDPTAQPIDVVSLSLGYFDEAALHGVTQKFAKSIEQLTALGVTVVAAAGNHSTSREFFPAALAGQFDQSSHAPMVSVGALNPNGTIAHFSDEGPWVSCYASGVAMVSTFPLSYAGSVNPAEAVMGSYRRRETFDPDDFSSGFALWSGTSFAAPLIAAQLAAALLYGATTDPAGLGLGDNSVKAFVNRGWQALAAVQKEWP